MSILLCPHRLKQRPFLETGNLYIYIYLSDLAASCAQKSRLDAGMILSLCGTNLYLNSAEKERVCVLNAERRFRKCAAFQRYRPLKPSSMPPNLAFKGFIDRTSTSHETIRHVD